MNNPRLYELCNGDIFFADIFHPPIGVLVLIHKVEYLYQRKWYNPFSWFKKHWYVKYEYVDGQKKNSPFGNLSPAEIPTELHAYKFDNGVCEIIRANEL